MLHITGILIFILCSILITIYFYFQYKYSFWKRNKIPYIEPSILFGNVKELVLQKKSSTEIFNELYSYGKKINSPIVGFYLFDTPALMVRDLNLVKKILIKDFKSFSNRYRKPTNSDKLGIYNLTIVPNPLWKLLRSKLTPLFSSGKIKQMFTSVKEIGDQFDNYLCKLTSETKRMEVELRNVCALYNTDVNSSVAYGINSNCLNDNNSLFRKNGKNLFTITTYRTFEFIILVLWPKMSKILNSKLFNNQVTNFLKETINYTMVEREKSGIPRSDLIDVLLDIKKEVKISDDPIMKQIDNDVLVAQAGIFFIGGFEPTSTNMSFTLYELSKKPLVQEKLRTEIKKTIFEHQEITLEVIQNMEYLNMVVLESLRLYPGLPFYERECTLQTDNEFYSLEPFSHFKIPKGMPIYVPALAIQRDEEYFINATDFNPERFAPKNKSNLNSDAYMPFGLGPHSCIGERFGLIQVKIGILNFLKSHRVEPCSKTQNQIKFAPSTLFQPEGGIYCNIIKDELL